ncbi:hypothetical protein FRB90_011981 [Tulasnella sp. 427]|nr:hypothetical protein FRB90_011981 [Tulasnella sp. 427]
MAEPRTTSKSTVYIGNIPDDANEQMLINVFSTFGDIMEVQIPTHEVRGFQGQGQNQSGGGAAPQPPPQNAKHRGFAFITFGTPIDAQDAIDNMDQNELQGKVLKVNLAKPMKGPGVQAMGNRAIWESEEWLKMYGTKSAEPGYGPPSKTGVPKSVDAAEEGGEDGKEDEEMEE